MGAVQFIENMDKTSLTITDEDFEKNVEAAVSAIAERHQALSPIIKQQATFNEKAGPDPSSSENPSTPQRPHDKEEDIVQPAPISGLFRTIQKPLSSIGRMFGDDTPSQAASPTPAPTSVQRPRSQSPNTAAVLSSSPRFNDEGADPSVIRDSARQQSPNALRHTLSAEDAAARQASAETAEAQRLQRAEHANVVETLAGMFPDLDRDVISDVVYEKEGR